MPDTMVGTLLERTRKADREAWCELYRRFDPLVVGAARQVGLNGSDAADAAQLTWMRLWQRGVTIRDPECLPGWLAVTARREGFRIARRGMRSVPCADPTEHEGCTAAMTTVDRYPGEGEYEPAVEQALAGLPTRHRQLIRMLMGDACPSYDEVSRRLQIPMGSIGPMRMRALQMLRRSLERSGYGNRAGRVRFAGAPA